MAESRKQNRVLRPTVNQPRNRTVASLSPQKRKVNLALAQMNAQKLQEESDRLNSFGNLAKQTIKGLPKAMFYDIPRQVTQHPLRTAGLATQGVGNAGINTVNALTSYAGIPKIPNLRMVKPQNSVEEGIEKGFEVGGTAGTYFAGTAALRPLLEAPKVVSALGRIPGMLSKTSKTPMLKPLAQTLVGDQILTQAIAGREASLKDRAIGAAVTPLATLGMHGLGRGGSMARTRIREALGDRIPKNTNLHQYHDLNLNRPDDEILKSFDEPGTGHKNIVRDPDTGWINADESVKSYKTLATGEVIPDTPPTFGDKWNAFKEKWISSGRTRLENYGEGGKMFSKIADEYYPHKQQIAATLKGQFKKLFQGTSKDDWIAVVKAQESPSLRPYLTPAQDKLFKNFHNLSLSIHEFAKKNNWKIMGPDGKLRPWNIDDVAADTHFSHYWFNDMPKPNKESMKALMVKQLMEEGGYTRFQAEQHAAASMKAGPNKLLGSTEHARVKGLEGYAGGERLPEIIDRMIDEFGTMQSRVKYFGQTGEKVEPLIEDMIKRGAKVEDVRFILDEMFGNSEVANPFIRNALRFQQASKLSLSGITNLTQVANTATLGGIKNTLASMWKYATNPSQRAAMKDFADIIGAVDQLNITQEANVPTTKIMDAALFIFKKTEEFNRVIAADVGRKFSRELISTIAKDKSNGYALRMLKQLGMNSDDIAKFASGRMTRQQEMMLANKFVTDTQFQLNAMNLPIWSRTPMGKLFSQFKSFGYMQTKFWRDHIVREAQNGNYTPLLRMVGTVPLLFMGAQKTRDVLTLRDEGLRSKLGMSNYEEPTEEEAAISKLEGLLQMTGALPATMTQSAIYAAKNNFGEGSEYRTPINKIAVASGNLLGPTISDVGNLVKAGEQSGDIQRENLLEGNQGEGNQIRTSWPVEKFGVGLVPYVGQAAKNAWYRDWPEREREVFRQSLTDRITEAVEAKDMDELREIRGAMKDQRELNVFQDVLSAVKKEVARKNLTPEEKERYNSIEQRAKDIKSLPFASLYGQE